MLGFPVCSSRPLRYGATCVCSELRYIVDFCCRGRETKSSGLLRLVRARLSSPERYDPLISYDNNTVCVRGVVLLPVVIVIFSAQSRIPVPLPSVLMVSVQRLLQIRQ